MLAAALTLVYSAVENPWLLLGLGPLVAFFGTGFFSGFALLAGVLLIGAATWIWLPETRGRGVAT